jgi:antitoxin YefM
MQTIYQINADEVDENLLDSIKAQFKHKEIEIVVSERDETAYLLRAPANRERLLRAIEDVEENRNIIVPNQEQFQ